MTRASRAASMENHTKHLAKSILSIGALHFSAMVAFNKEGLPSLSIGDCLKWSSVVSLIGGLYYVLFLFVRRCLGCNGGSHTSPYTNNRSQSVYRDLPAYPPPSVVSPLVDSSASLDTSAADVENSDSPAESRDNIFRKFTLPPELSLSNVWIHVYGWGLMLFVSIYSLSGMYVSGANWWSLSILILAMEELINHQIPMTWVMGMFFFITASAFAVWWGVMSQRGEDQNFSEILTGVFAPALSPFMLYSIKFNVRNVSKDISKLVEIALPFVIIISACVMAIESHKDPYIAPDEGDNHRRFMKASNFTGSANLSSGHDYVESHALFQFNQTPAPPQLNHIANTLSFIDSAARAAAYDNREATRIVAALLTPVFALAVVWTMISSVIEQCATEFVVALTLCTAVRYGAGRVMDLDSAVALSSSGLAFILIILLRKRG